MSDSWRRVGDPQDRYVRPSEDLRLTGVAAGTCVLTMSGSLFDAVLDRVPGLSPIDNQLNARLPFAHDANGTLVHFPMYGSPRIAAAVEQLQASGVRRLIGVGLCGSLTPDLPIGTVVVPTGAVRTDAVSLHYAPLNYPAVPEPRLISRVLGDEVLAAQPVLHLSTDALYRETYDFVDGWRALGVETIDMEVATLFVTARVLGLEAVWIGVVSDLLHEQVHTGAIGAHHVMDRAVSLVTRLLGTEALPC